MRGPVVDPHVSRWCPLIFSGTLLGVISVFSYFRCASVRYQVCSDSEVSFYVFDFGFVESRAVMDERKMLHLFSRLHDGKPPADIQSEVPMPFQRPRLATRTSVASGHRVDECALSILPTYFPDSASLLPYHVYGDGNCLFRAASLQASGSQSHHLEL